MHRKYDDIDPGFLVYRVNGNINWLQSYPQNIEESFEDWRSRVKKIKAAFEFQKLKKDPKRLAAKYKTSLAWKKNNPEKHKEYNVKRYANKRAMVLYAAARLRASKKNIEFSIKLEQIEKAINSGACQATGINFDFKRKKSMFTPSIDRILPEIGYTETNTWLVCWGFNSGKHTGSLSELIYLSDAIVKNKKNIIQAANSTKHDLVGAIIEKNEFNRNRQDHKLENRAISGGKRY